MANSHFQMPHRWSPFSNYERSKQCAVYTTLPKAQCCVNAETKCIQNISALAFRVNSKLQVGLRRETQQKSLTFDLVRVRDNYEREPEHRMESVLAG